MTEKKGKGEGDEHPKDGKIYHHPPAGGKHAEALAEVTRAYAQGDMYMARKQALAVAADAPSDEERAFAELVIHRTANDPLALILGLATLALFFVIVFWTLQ